MINKANSRRSAIPQKQLIIIIIIILRKHGTVILSSHDQVFIMKLLSSCKLCHLLSFCAGVSSGLAETLLDIGKKMSPKISQIWFGHIQTFTFSKSAIETLEKKV